MGKKNRALKILATVQTGPEDKMAIEQGSGFSKKAQKILGRHFWTGLMGLNGISEEDVHLRFNPDNPVNPV
jgi:hypothetical protein